MNNCGKCRWYSFWKLEATYTKTGRPTGYLQEKPCFEPKNNKTVMEENKTQTKVCKRCGRELPIEKFGKHFRAKDGLNPYCKECVSQIQKEAAARKKPETVEPTPDLPEPKLNHIPTLAGFQDDDLISELVDRGWTGRIAKTITVSYHISPDGIKIE